MIKLQDTNIARVLGVCRQDTHLAVVVEYPSHGDLHHFLLNTDSAAHHNSLRQVT